jgi:hypothetical protein
MQTTNKVLMVRPINFGYNEETSKNNLFQQKTETPEEALEIKKKAIIEFDLYVKLLKENGIEVDILQDTNEPSTPDSIFPNNCFSTHCEEKKEGKERTLVIYPMFANNRREERKKLLPFLNKMKFDKIIDLTDMEKENKYLEGTGSLILDREHHFAFACKSERTNEDVLKKWSEKMNYEYFLFESEDEKGKPIYHTNVMMHIGTKFAIVCLNSIKNNSQKEKLIEILKKNGKEIIEITVEQMTKYAGNMLELINDKKEKLLIMSTTAKNSLSPNQIKTLEEDVKIISPEIPIIEKTGGGSARCMLAEIYY